MNGDGSGPATILDDLGGWDGGLPVGLVRLAATTAVRRAACLAFARGVAGDASAVVVHADGRAPSLVGGALHLSSASRDGLAAFAAASGPVGIDVERIEPGAEPPVRVLHPAERAALARLPAPERAAAFATIWTCKEAYGKALGLGLAHDPAAYEVRLGPAGPAIRDPGQAAQARITLAGRRWNGRSFVLALVAILR